MKKIYTIALMFGLMILFVGSVYAIEELAKKKSVNIDTAVDMNEDIYNELATKGNIEQQIVDEGVKIVQDKEMKKAFGEFEYQYWILINSMDYEGIKQTTEYMKNINKNAKRI